MLGTFLMLMGLLPYPGSLVGFKLESFSRPPSFFKVQFHEAGPRLELGLHLDLHGFTQETTQNGDSTSDQAYSRTLSLGGNLALLQPVFRRSLPQGRLQGLVGFGPWVSVSLSRDSLQPSSQWSYPQTQERTGWDVGLGFLLGLEYAFTLKGLDLRLQGLVQALGLSWYREETKTRTWHTSEPEKETATRAEWRLQGLSVTQGNLGVWLFVGIP